MGSSGSVVAVIQEGLPGLLQEVRDICNDIGIADLNKSYSSKSKMKEVHFYLESKAMEEKINSSS